jgi:hypothetical protein
MMCGSVALAAINNPAPPYSASDDPSSNNAPTISEANLNCHPPSPLLITTRNYSIEKMDGGFISVRSKSNGLKRRFILNQVSPGEDHLVRAWRTIAIHLVFACKTISPSPIAVLQFRPQTPSGWQNG